MLALIGVFHTLRIGRYPLLIDEKVRDIESNWINAKKQYNSKMKQKESLFHDIKNSVDLLINSRNDLNIIDYWAYELAKYIHESKLEPDVPPLRRISSNCFSIIYLYKQLKQLKRTIKQVFIVNGVIIGLFILSFISVPLLCVQQRIIFIIISSLFVLFSLYTMVIFVIASINEEMWDLFGFDIIKMSYRKSQKISK